MKLGAENRTKLILAVALLVVAVALGARFVGSMGGGSPIAAAPAAAAGSHPETLTPARTTKGLSSGKKPASSHTMDPSLRFDLLKASEDTKYEGRGRDVFRAFVDPPPRILAPVVKNPVQQQAQAPPTPPPPPPINLKFFGFAISKPGEGKHIFLVEGEDIFIAKEGDIVDRRYKVVRISPNAVEILDVLSNYRQSIPLSG